MTRTHKTNDRDHVGLANGTAEADQHLPRYFGKSGHVDSDPKGIKKAGSGKGNWGAPGDEIDDSTYNLHHQRRRSNSFQAGSFEYKSKFELVEPEPVDEVSEGHLYDLDDEENGDGAALQPVQSFDQRSIDSFMSMSSDGIEEAPKKK